MTSFAALRAERQEAWRAELVRRLHALVTKRSADEPLPDQVWLFGSRARGDWDGWSDTDLIVVAQEPLLAELWADRLMDGGLGADVIAMDREHWQALPTHPSAIWRAVAQQAIPLLGQQP
ncbi:MAG: nucleotidyltransferase domain-containing protein [Vulcanococcus sp.]